MFKEISYTRQTMISQCSQRDQHLMCNHSKNEKTWEKMVASFKTIFYPFNIQNKARRTMNHLVQNLRDHEEEFQKYVMDFQLAAVQTGIKDKETLIKAFTTGLDPSLGQMAPPVKDTPTMLNKWIKQASKFHAQQK